MHIERTRYIDSSEPDESGAYEYYYEYDVYYFSDGPFRLVACGYTDMPYQASFVRIEKNGKGRLLTKADLAHPLMLMAQAYLRNEGKTHFEWLNRKSSLYESVPDIQATSADRTGLIEGQTGMGG